MGLTTILETCGDSTVLALGASSLVFRLGVLSGGFAQRSKFCLRAAASEFGHRKVGAKLFAWLPAFSSAVVGVQLLILAHSLDVCLYQALMRSRPGFCVLASQ